VAPSRSRIRCRRGSSRRRCDAFRSWEIT
jgi:hypothetical protein